MKKCKACQKEIDPKASKCPYCQADQRGWFARHKVLTGFLVLVVLIIIIVASSSGSKSQKVGQNGTSQSTTAGQNQPATQPTVYKVGDQIQLGNAIISVNQVSFSQGSEFSKPQPGDEWVDLNITIQNTSSSDQYVTTLGQMFIRDSDGNSYQVTPTDKAIADPGQGLDGQIIANSKRTGWVGFEVKQGAKGLQFQYNASVFGGNNILVNLGS